MLVRGSKMLQSNSTAVTKMVRRELINKWKIEYDVPELEMKFWQSSELPRYLI